MALRGGSKKGVYRVTCTGGATVIVYVWDDAHDNWPAEPDAQPDDGSNPLTHASGLDLFVAAMSGSAPSASARRTWH